MLQDIFLQSNFHYNNNISNFPILQIIHISDTCVYIYISYFFLKKIQNQEKVKKKKKRLQTAPDSKLILFDFKVKKWQLLRKWECKEKKRVDYIKRLACNCMDFLALFLHKFIYQYLSHQSLFLSAPPSPLLLCSSNNYNFHYPYIFFFSLHFFSPNLFF